MGDTVSFTWDNTTEVNTNKNGYTEAQQREYMVRTASDLVKENRKVQEEELYTDSNFIDSMRILYNKEQGMDAETPEDKELVKWGLSYLADVNYNLVDLGEAAYDFSEATDLEKMAMAYGLDTYDSKDVTMDGVQRFAEAFATDPTNLIGFGTLGAGFAAKFTGKTLAKQAFKKMLMNPANIAAIEGAAFLGAEDTMRQNLDVEIGAQEEYSATQGLTSVAVGAVGGKVLGEVASWAGKKLSKVPKEAIDEVQTIQAELNSPQIKSDFGPELLVGGIAGIEEDEQGNISFDPIKFMEGFLAGHVAKRIMANKKLTEPMKKEAMAYAQRTFDKLEANPKFDYLTGTMRVIETGASNKKLSISDKFNKDVEMQIKKHGNIDDIEYSMMDISDRDRTRVQRVRNTIIDIETDPEEAIYTVPNFNEFKENYADQFKYAQPKISPIEKGNKVKIFRSAIGDIEPGDWIGLDKNYANSHSRTSGHKLYEMWVNKEDIRWQGQDANEWIYLPKEIIDNPPSFKKQ